MLALEEAVGVVALDLDGRGLDARLVAILVIHDGVLIAVALRPADIHAVEHGRPVLCLRAARAGMQRQERVVRVVFAGQQGSQPHRLCLFGEVLILALQLLEHGVVVLLDGHLAHGVHIVPRRAELLIILAFVLEGLQPLLDLLGVLYVVPEIRALAGSLQLFYLLLRCLKLQRAAQDFESRLGGVELRLIFFKFKHSIQLLSKNN